MSDPKKVPADFPEIPDVDQRANEAFFDAIFDTDGRPNSEAVDIVEIEGIDDEDEVEQD